MPSDNASDQKACQGLLVSRMLSSSPTTHHTRGTDQDEMLNMLWVLEGVAGREVATQAVPHQNHFGGNANLRATCQDSGTCPNELQHSGFPMHLVCARASGCFSNEEVKSKGAQAFLNRACCP